MNIREYGEKDYPVLQRLLRELQEYIIRLDTDGLNTITSDFPEIYTNNLLCKINEGKGRIYVAEAGNEIVGFIAGIMESYDEDDRVTYQCPAEGRIIELYVDKHFRKKAIGSQLIDKIEEYFKSCGCENVRVGVFSNNAGARDFYSSHQYRARTEELMKKL